jgi:hypothetical protein
MQPGRDLALVSILLGACAGQLNPSVPTPKPGELAAKPGLWVAYNLGCEQGCDKIRRGDIITAIDGAPVTSGAEIDAADLARGTPVQLELQSRKRGKLDITLRATPNQFMRPLMHAPPLWTVGTEALDRAPAWARLKAFGHATPALRFYRMDDPRGFRNGRELYGRHTLIVLWTPDNYRVQNWRRNNALLPQVYARLQAHEAELRAAGVDVVFMLPGRADPLLRGYIRSQIAVDAYGWAPNMIPIFANATDTSNPNTLGLQHQAADLNELVFRDGHVGPILLIIDARGIVRWHSRGWHNEDPFSSIESVVGFAARQLGDPAPGAAPAPVPVPPVEPAAAPVSTPASSLEPVVSVAPGPSTSE